MRKTGYVWEQIYTEHVMSDYHPECPARLLTIKDVLEKTDVGKAAIKLQPRPATPDEIAWVHDQEYIASIEAAKGRRVQLDPDTSTSEKTYEAALLAAGGAITCTEAVLKGEVDNAFAFVRPPGHHAERDQAMGFCIYNNVAIAAEFAIKKMGVKRIAIVDFDIHHGNGTEHSFYKRNNVFYISTHRSPFFPGTGERFESGEGLGKGYTLNIPLERGDDAEFKEIYGGPVKDVLLEYKPELILVSAGYDAHVKDPLGGYSATTETYNWITESLLSVADVTCGGKMVMLLEGGYDVVALADCVKGALGVLEK